MLATSVVVDAFVNQAIVEDIAKVSAWLRGPSVASGHTRTCGADLACTSKVLDPPWDADRREVTAWKHRSHRSSDRPLPGRARLANDVCSLWTPRLERGTFENHP